MSSTRRSLFIAILLTVLLLLGCTFMGASSTFSSVNAEKYHPSISKSAYVPTIKQTSTKKDAEVWNDIALLDEVPTVTNISYQEAQTTKYRDAITGTKERSVFNTLSSAYKDFENKPVRALNDNLTNDLAQELGNNESYDASNFVITYFFDMDIGDYYLDLLYDSEKNYLLITFDLGLTSDAKAPLIMYKCHGTDSWQLTEEGVNNGDGSATYKFYELCPLVFIETSDSPADKELHKEWDELYPVNDTTVTPFNMKWLFIIVPFIIIIILIGTYIVVKYVNKRRYQE